MKGRWSISILSLAEIVIGVLLLMDPVRLTTWIVRALGAALIVLGVFGIVQYFRASAAEAALKRSLAGGILAALVGLWAVFKSDWILALFPLLTSLYGVAVLISGVTKVQWTADMFRLKQGRWSWMALSAALTLLCAAVILADPFATTTALWRFIGIALIVQAAADIVAAVFKK